MPKRHMKRLTAPKTWPIERKGTTFVTRPNPGNAFRLSLPITIIFKDVLKYCKTSKEVKRILQDKEVLCDGKRRKDSRYPVGLMEVMSIPAIGEAHRVLLSTKGKLVLIPIDKKEIDTKLCKVINKTVLKGGAIQLNLSDGRNLTVKKNEYAVNDVVVLDTKSNKVAKHLKLGEKAHVLLVGGKHMGANGKITKITDKLVEVEAQGMKITTDKKFAFVVGEDKPIIKMSD